MEEIWYNSRFSSGKMGQPATGFLIDGDDSILGIQGSEYGCVVQLERVEDLVLEDTLETLTGPSLNYVPQKLEGHVRIYGCLTGIGDRSLLRQLVEKVYMN